DLDYAGGTSYIGNAVRISDRVPTIFPDFISDHLCHTGIATFPKDRATEIVDHDPRSASAERLRHLSPDRSSRSSHHHYRILLAANSEIRICSHAYLLAIRLRTRFSSCEFGNGSGCSVGETSSFHPHSC